MCGWRLSHRSWRYLFCEFFADGSRSVFEGAGVGAREELASVDSTFRTFCPANIAINQVIGRYFAARRTSRQATMVRKTKTKVNAKKNKNKKTTTITVDIQSSSKDCWQNEKFKQMPVTSEISKTTHKSKENNTQGSKQIKDRREIWKSLSNVCEMMGLIDRPKCLVS